jgi:hypothetical protein
LAKAAEASLGFRPGRIEHPGAPGAFCQRHPRIELELKLEVRLAKDLNYPVDVRFLEAAPLSFQFAVVRDGRVVVDSEPNRRAAFEGIVRKKYFDFAIFRRRYLKEAAHARV